MRYAKYKPTGIAWLPEVPEGWEMVLNQFLFKENIRVPTAEDIPLSLSQADGLLPTDDMKEKSLKTSTYDGWKRVLVDDLVLNRFKAHLGVFFASRYEGMVSFHYGVFAKRRELLPRYYEYLFHTPQYRFVYSWASKGMIVGLQNLSNTDFYKIWSPLPPVPTQREIVAFLDEKCGKVDRLVAAKEKEVALLKELKQSMIAEAVCGREVKVKGEGEQRKFKSSGIPWLPEVPEGWATGKVRQYFKLRATKVSEKDYPPLSVAKIGVVPQLSDVALSMAEGDTRKLVKEGDYVVNSRSDRKGSCGIAPRDGSVTTISIVLEPHDIDRKYVHYLFRSTPWVEEFYRNGRGIVADLWTTNYNQMRNMMLPVPPLAEQREIVAHIEARAAKIDAAVSGLEKEIAALKEYKQRLIADVVTGQRKVA